MIGKYCRDYRVSKKVTLLRLGGAEQVKNLSAFEHGRSRNVEHLELYLKLSLELNDKHEFMNGLFEVVGND